MKKADVFPSKYLKSDDLQGRPITVTIERAPLETLKSPDGKEQKKIVLYFRGAKKALPLNVTNWDSCVDACGDDDTDGWPGKQIELYPAKTQMAGKTVDCVRPSAGTARAAEAETAGDRATAGQRHERCNPVVRLRRDSHRYGARSKGDGGVSVPAAGQAAGDGKRP